MKEPLGVAAAMSYPVLTPILESKDSLTMQLNSYTTDYTQTSYLLINSMLILAILHLHLPQFLYIAHYWLISLW